MSLNPQDSWKNPSYLSFISKVSLRKVSLREPCGGQLFINYAYQRYLYCEISWILMIQKFYIMEVCGNIFQNIKNVLDIVSGPRGKKWLKVIHQFKIVNYFTCMRHFSCSWFRSPEVALNWYPRISNPYCQKIQIQRCEWSQGYKMTQSKLPIKNSQLFYMYVLLPL